MNIHSVKQFIGTFAIATLCLMVNVNTVFTPTAVTWGNKILIDTAGTQISKTSGENELWDSGALTSESITTEGTFTFTVQAFGNFRVGLSTDPATDNVPTHYWQFASAPGEDAGQVREVIGGWVHSVNAQVGDTFSIVVASGGVVSYKHNGTTVYTSSDTVTLPVNLDFSALVSGSAISDATIDIPEGGGDEDPPGDGGTEDEDPSNVLTVCTTGCDYTTVQAAVTAATADTLILLEEGKTFTEDVSLPVKSGAAADARVEIRTGVSSTGVIQATSRYPGAGIRICPQGFSQDWYSCSGKAGEVALSRIAKIKPATNNAYAIRTANTGTGTSVSHYKLKWLQVIPNAFAGNALIGITNETAGTNGTADMLPHHITLDRVVVGEEGERQFRGIQFDGNNLTFKNSHLWVAHESEGQGFWANTSTGPINVENNYMSGGTEVFLTGGGGTTPGPVFTVSASPTPTTIAFAVSGTTDLYVGKNVAVRLAPKTVTSLSIASDSVVTTSTAHGYSAGHQVQFSGTSGCANPSGTNVNNWAHTILSTPTSTTFVIDWQCTSSGSGGTVTTRAQAEITNIAGSTLTVTPALPHTPATGDAVESSFVIRELTVRFNVFTRPSIWRTDNPNDYQTKNTFELKQGREVTVEYNIIENSWQDGQAGPCVPFTATQQGVEADSAVIRDVDFRYNVVRHCGQWFQFPGTDALGHESARSGDIRFVDNLIYDVWSTYATASGASIGGAGGGPRQHPNRAPYDLSFIHNTIHITDNEQNNVMYFDYCAPSVGLTGTGQESTSPNTIIKDNILYSGTYGIPSTAPGNDCGDGMSIGRIGSPPMGSGSSINNNAFVGGTESAAYIANTTNMTYPSVATAESDIFTSVTAVAGFAIKSTSSYYAGGANDATDGESLGADISAIQNGLVVTESGDNSGDVSQPATPTGTRIRLRIRGLLTNLLDLF